MSAGAAQHRGWRTVGAPVALFVGASVFAMSMSWSVSLWNDEAVTLSAAARTPAELWALLQRLDAVHGLYYAAMMLWTDVAGNAPFIVRLPSALASGGTALGVLLLVRRMASDRTAWLAAVVCATLPRIAWAGIEARSFVFSALVAVWATFALVRALERPAGRRWAVYGLLSALGILINIYLVLLVAAHGVTVGVLARRDRRPWLGYLAAAASAVIVSAPLVLLARSQQSQLGTLGDRSVVGIVRKVLVNQLFLGETPTEAAAAPWFTRLWQIAALVAAVIGVGAMLLALVRRFAPGDDRRSLLAVAVPWLVLPTAVIAGYAILVAPLYQPRYLTFAAPAGAILIAVGLRTLTRRWWVVAGAVAYGVAVLIVFASQRIPFAKSGSDWGAVADVVETGAQDGDAVYFAPRGGDSADGIVSHTTRRIEDAYPQAFADLDDLTLTETGAATGTLDGYSRSLSTASSSLDDHATVWAIFSKKAPASVFDEDDALLRSLGFEGERRWDGPSTVVVEYTRAN